MLLVMQNRAISQPLIRTLFVEIDVWRTWYLGGQLCPWEDDTLEKYRLSAEYAV